jgi:hypothetical protein
MYRVALKTAVIEALASVFTDSHPNTDFRGKNKPLVSIEYPMLESHYPAIWVQYADDSEITIAGIGHTEQFVDEDTGTVGTASRWKFAGAVTMTIATLSSQERDRLFDEVVRVFVGARFNPALTQFRERIESNDLVAINANFDDIEPFGDAAPMGTPWGTDEIIYEVSLRFDVIGEFLTDILTAELVPLSEVTFMDYVEESPTPEWPGPGSTTAPPTPGDWDRTDPNWH